MSSTSMTQNVSEQLEISSPIVAPIISTTPALTSVMVCMAIMAVCAVAYFAIHCYLEERRLSQSPILPCKCGKAGNAINGNQIELVSAPRQGSMGVNMAVQTVEMGEQFASWTEVHMSAKRNECAYSSPMTNNDAPPCWRPPATGSSRCYATTNRKHRRRYRRRIPPSNSAVPSITINSPSSSDSYSVLTNSRNFHSMSKSMIKDLTTTMSPSIDDDEEEEEAIEELPQTSPYHPRYNTPVSENTEEQEHQMSAEGVDAKDFAAASPETTAAPSTRDVASQPSTNFHLKSLHTLNAERDEANFQNHSSPTMVAPHFEVWPGGKLVTRSTQTDNKASSLASLDWDHYDSERLRCADQDDERMDFGRNNSGLTISHTSDTTPHVSRTSHVSPSSPYVLCYECSDEFGINNERKQFHRRCPRNFYANSSTPAHQEPLDLRTAGGSNSRKCRTKPARK